jgi:hypothetical protein
MKQTDHYILPNAFIIRRKEGERDKRRKGDTGTLGSVGGYARERREIRLGA